MGKSPWGLLVAVRWMHLLELEGARMLYDTPIRCSSNGRSEIRALR